MSETRAAQPKKDRAAGPAASAASAASTAAPDGLFVDALCGVDGTRRSFAAVEQAADLAGPDGRLTLLAVTAVTGAGVNRRAAISPARAEQLLERAERIAQRRGVPCTAVIDPSSPPPQVILERASGHDLLALGAPPSSWLGGRLIQGVTEAALGSFTVPLLVARAMPAGEHRFPDRILLASDGLDGSDQLVDLAGRLARQHNASVTLLHTIGVESNARPHRIQDQASRLQQATGGASDVRVEVGAAAELIVEAAKREASSLVVMSSRRLGGLKAIGSVSRRVVHDAHCSVLLVPPERLQG